MNVADLPLHEQGIFEKALTAMEAGRCLSINYNGLDRLVEVHALGTTITGKPCMRVFQVQGDSISLEDTGWKLMSLGKVDDAKIVDYTSSAPRDGYQKGDKGMSEIFSEI